MIGAFLRTAHRVEAETRARAVLERVGLSKLADAPARTLGTPGRKRLEIARALATEPKVLLLDEAMAGLTQREVQLAIDLVRDIHRSGVTLVIVEHIMEVIMSLASRVVVFHQGREIARGSPREVTGNPAVIEAYLGKRAARAAAGHTPIELMGGPRMSAPLLRIEHLEVHYGDLIGVSDVSLEVPEGSVVALLGSNGGGKTTTLNAIAGLIPVHSGSIAFRGQEIGGQAAFSIVRKGLALSPEGWRLFVQQSVQNNLLLGATPLRDKARAAMLLERVYEIFPRLAERRGQRAGTMSGGERQMLAVGRALMSDPKLLMLDEPSLGLAPAVVESMYETFGRLHQDGLTILLAEQSIELALEVSDFATVLQVGKSVLSGTAADLANDPQGAEGLSRYRLISWSGLDIGRAGGSRTSLGGLLDRAVRSVVPVEVGGSRSSPAGKRVRELVEIEIDHRRREQGQRLADEQAADHRVAERLADFRAGACAQHQRHAAQHRRHRRHHDRPEAQQRGLADRSCGDRCSSRSAAMREVDHHDAVLLDDADQQDDADQRDQAEIESEQHQDRERADAGRGQRREDRQRVDVALIENAEDEVDDDQRRQRSAAARCQRMLERLRVALEARVQRGRHAQFGLAALDRRRSPDRARRPGARLKLMVIAGNWPWWLIDSGWTGVVVHVAKVDSGTSLAGRRRLDIELVERVGSPCRLGRTSRMTW